MNYTDFIQDRDEFSDRIKDELRQRAFEKLDDMKKEMANEFLTSKENDNESY